MKFVLNFTSEVDVVCQVDYGNVIYHMNSIEILMLYNMINRYILVITITRCVRIMLSQSNQNSTIFNTI